ncbi:MAG: FAD-dependent oxidoreductase [Rhizomicrobium sp.]
MTTTSLLNSPIRIGAMTAPNRIMMATHGPRLPQARYLGYLEARAAGGVGLFGFNVGALGISPFPFGPGRTAPPFAAEPDAVPPHPRTAEGRTFYDGQIGTYRVWSDAVHRHGAKSIGQLYHPGAARHADNYQPAVGPSAVADELEGNVPRALTRKDIADLTQAYALGARRALEARCDGLELHAAHGYLLHEFLSPLFNQRDDIYGGTLENRLRLVLEILAAVRDAIDDACPVGLRLTGPDNAEGGLSLEDIVHVATRATQSGAAYISISAGTYAGLLGGKNLPYVAPGFVRSPPNVAAAAAVRRAVAVPVIVTGRIVDLAIAEDIVRSEAADVVGIVRGLIAEPRLAAKHFQKSDELPTPCIACNECHTGQMVACPTNPSIGWEVLGMPKAAEKALRVLVIGAGPAGIQCALTAAERGHPVELVERDGEIGGLTALLARSTEQADYAAYLRYATTMLGRRGVNLRLNTEADAALIVQLSPDVVVLATGAVRASRPGYTDPVAAMNTPALSGRHVVVDGGVGKHLPPLICANRLAEMGCRVTLVTQSAAPGEKVEAASRIALLASLSARGVAIVPGTRAGAFENRALSLRNVWTGATTNLADIDAVVCADNRFPGAALERAVRDLGLPVHVIGDALAPRRMLHASLDGARLGNTL